MLKWETKRKMRGLEDNCDVVICQINDERKSSSIKFKNNSHLKITKNMYVVFAIDGTRLYFKDSNMFEGWKLTKGKTKYSAACFKVNPEVLPLTKVEPGCYNLELDEDQMLWYIDITHKIKERLNWNGKRSYR